MKDLEEQKVLETKIAEEKRIQDENERIKEWERKFDIEQNKKEEEFIKKFGYSKNKDSELKNNSTKVEEPVDEKNS